MKDFMYIMTFSSSFGHGKIEVPINGREYVACRTYGGAMKKHNEAVDRLFN